MTGVTGGYRNEQLYGIDRAGEQAGYFTADGQYRLTGANNPPFIYPAREIITQDGRGNVKKQHLARGYIRSLTTSASGIPVPVRKCGFQFNPQYLSTSVAMAQDVLNTFQQDIGQLNTPLAANSNFLFQLFFDRSMELNNNTVGTGVTTNDNNVGAGDPENTNIFAGTDALAPSQIGVFRDIGELNAVIGAGLSPDIVEYSRNLLNQQINANFNSQSDVTDTKGLESALGKVNDFVGSVNFGNSAFLLPRPVRAVFSSLFMVEGFVTNIDINYTKFTTAMVPMQATVTLTMNAQYIGYAKKRTYVTATLQKNADEYANQQKALQADVNGLVAALQSAAGKVRFTHRAPDRVNGYAHTTDDSGVQLQDFLFAKFGSSVAASLWVPGSVNSDHTSVKDKDPVALAVDGHSSSFSGSVLLTISGPYGSNPANPTSTTLSAPQGPGRGTSIAIEVGPSWKDFATSPSDTTKGKTTYALISDQIDPAVIDNPSNWWLITAAANFTATLDGVVTTGTGSMRTATKDITSTGPFLNCDIPITWVGVSIPGQNAVTSSSSTTGTSSPSVPKTNNTSGSNSPGSTSSVGSKTTTTKPKVKNGRVYI